MSTTLIASPDRIAPALLIRTPWPDGGVLHYAQDREIYGEGDEADIFFKLVSGVVRTCKFLSDGRRQIDAFYVAGDIFGVEAAADYSFYAEAVCDCSVMSYRRSGLDSLAFNDASLSKQLFAYAMHNLARAQDHALLLGRRSATEKVAIFLADWAKRSPSGKDVSLAMTRQDIADYLGLTIETVSRTLSLLERQAMIVFASPRQIRIIDPVALQSLNA